MFMEGRVINPIGAQGTDNSEYVAGLGRQMDVLTSGLHGPFYTQTYRGATFIATTTTASAIPVSNTTSPTFILWNRSSGTNAKNAVLVRYTAGWAATTEAPGTILFNFLSPAGFSLATAAPISALTAGTVNNALLGGGLATAMSFGTAATLTAAGTILQTTGMSHLTTTGTSTAVPGWTNLYDFNGTVIVPPGVAFYTTASTATATTYHQTLIWYEAPL